LPLIRNILCSVLAALVLAPPSGAAGPIRVWYPGGFGKLDAQGRRLFAVQTDSYKFVYDLAHPSMTELCNLVRDPSGGPNLLRTSGAPGGHIALMDDSGTGYTSYASDGNARITVVKGPNTFNNVFQTRLTFRQAGRPYYQLDVVGIRLRSAAGAVAPVTVTQRFHLWPEKFYVETIFRVESNVSVRFAETVTAFDPALFGHVSSQTLGLLPISPWQTLYLPAEDPYLGLVDTSGAAGSVSHVCANRTGTDSVVFYSGAYQSGAAAPHIIHRAVDFDVRGGAAVWTAGQTKKIYSQIYFSGRGDTAELDLDASLEASPADVTKVTSSSGASAAVPYDSTSGCYRVEIPPDYPLPTAPYSDYADVFQNHYETAHIRIANGPQARPVRLKMVRGLNISGSSPWGEMVVTDAAGFPLGIPTSQNSRWGGADPDAYFACYASVPVEGGETKDLQLKIVSQNWGAKPIIRMQCQDLFDWEGSADEQQWMQSSIGLGESMVYHVQRVWCTVEDARGLDSRPLGQSASWRDNCGGWEFLKFSDGTRPASRGMTYRRSGPNLFDFHLLGEMDDGSITSDVRVIAVPANEVTRTFFHIRYDVKKDISMYNIPSKLRLFALGDEYYGAITYPRVAYTSSSGAVVDQAVSAFINRQIGGTTPWACTYGANPPVGSGGNRGFVVRSFRSMVNGKVSNRPAITLNTGGQTRLILTAYTAETALKAGDYFEFDLETVAFGTPSSDFSRMALEAAAFGAGRPSLIGVHHGTKLADFPARVDIGPDGYADFTFTGGRDIIPVEVGGFAEPVPDSAAEPFVEEFVGEVWAPVDLSVARRDWWQVEREDDGTYTYVLCFYTDGSPKRLRVSRGLTLSQAEDAERGPGLSVFPFGANEGGHYVARETNSPLSADDWLVFRFRNLSTSPHAHTAFVRYASVTGASVRLSVNGADTGSSLELPATGGANIWREVAVAELSLDPGENTVRMSVVRGGGYVDRMQWRFERPSLAMENDAVPVAADVPFNISSNVPTVCRITMRNTGTSVWEPGQGFDLHSESELGQPATHPLLASVPPGGQHTFEFTCPPALAAVKLWQSRWRMRRNGSAFGTPCTVFQRSTDIVITYGNYRVLADDIPVRMSAGESRAVAVSLRNTGTTTWLGTQSMDAARLVRADWTFGAAGGGQNLPEGVSVAPGGRFDFQIGITAPSTPGFYTLRLRMRNRQTGVFGPFILREIEVVPDANPPGAPIVMDAGMYAGNTGTLTASWTAQDAEGPIVMSSYAIGQSPDDPGTGYLRGWTETPGMSVAASGLALADGATYYIYVRVRDAAGMWSPVGVSDGITVVHAVSRLSDVRQLEVGTRFALPDVVVTAAGGALVFVQSPDRSSGLKLNWAGTPPEPGRLAGIAAVWRGFIGTEPTADALSIDPGSPVTVAPLGMSNRSVGWPGAGIPPHSGTDNRCLLVRVWGRVIYAGEGFFLLDDGSGISDFIAETGSKGLRVDLPAGAATPAIGSYVQVTGISRAAEGSRRRVMPRGQTDVSVRD